MTWAEQPRVFRCGDELAIAIAHVPERPSTRGVLVVVGGPQYRVGSHRQFVLLARHLCDQGFAVLRFDYRGMGDSSGDARTFENIGADIHCAINQLQAEIPQIKEVVIWGLCDAASAALFYAPHDARVTGMVLLNPWVRTQESMARVHLKHYYLERILSRRFWHELVSGKLKLARGLRSVAGDVSTALQSSSKAQSADSAGETAPLPIRMAQSLARFRGHVLVILSGNDLTANEFRQVCQRDPQWRRLLRSSHVTERSLAPANHTFSKAEWRDQVARWTAEWMRAW